MSITDLFVDQDHQHYLDAAAAKSRTVGHDAAPGALDETFLAAVEVVRAFPATARLAWDVQNSLAQRVVDAVAELLPDPDEVDRLEQEVETAEKDYAKLDRQVAKLEKRLEKLGARPVGAK